MRRKEKPASPWRRAAGRKQKYKRHPHGSTRKRKNQQHWSREPRQREKDAALLAAFGLGFEKTKSGFFTFKKVAVPEPELPGVVHE